MRAQVARNPPAFGGFLLTTINAVRENTQFVLSGAEHADREQGMKKIVYKSKAIQAVILIIAAILLATLWPLRIWHEKVTTSFFPETITMTGVIDEKRTLLQEIVAQYDHMDTIDVYLDENCVGESFYLRILDEQWQVICEEKTTIDYENLPGFQTSLIDVDMEVGKMYYVILQGEESEIFAGYEAAPLADMPYMGTMYYADSTMEGVSLVANYNYGVPLRKTKVLAFGLLILGVAALLIMAVRLLYKKKEDRLITVEKMFQRVMNPVVGVAVIFCLGAVLLGFCGHYFLDNAMYFVGILFLGVILFYGINHSREGQKAVFTWDYLRSHSGDLIQSVAIAGAIAGCCDYMSGLYDIHHAAAERKEMFWFAIAVIAMFQWKEIFHLYNLIYLVAAGIVGFRYYSQSMAAFPEDVEEPAVVALKYTVLIGILLGLIVIRTIIALCKKKLTKPRYFYAGLLAVFFAMIIIFRNGRWWGVAMVVAFTLFYLNYGMWEHKDRILVNIARGIIFQFSYATGYALLYRPYVTYRNARYTHIFHTVTITAAYLTMVECAAVVILLDKLKKSRKLKDCWKELTLFGVVSSYMIFTMARTAFFSAGVTLLFALVVVSAGKGKKRLVNIGKNMGMLILSVMVCFPVTFTAQRNIPALVSEPFLYEIEYSMYCPEDVMRGRKLDSVNFMRVGRFIDVFSEKIFGLPEGTFDVYGEIAEYERTHRDEDEEQTDAKAQNVEIEASDQLVASLGEVPDDLPEDNDYTNGRLDIFRSYLEQLNATGHKEMGAVLENGEIATHAHNIYLQVAYDHGIWVGILFVVVGIVTFGASCLYYHVKKDKITYAALPLVVTVAVAVAGMVEWVFHLSNPCGLLLMLVITPLVFKNEG